MNSVGEIRMLPVYPKSIEWTIYDYYNMPQRADTYFNSPSFIFEECSWCLRLYPNGCRIDSTIGDVELHLVKMSAGKVYHVSYSVGLKNGDGTIHSSKQVANYFIEVDVDFGDEIIKRSDLLRWRRTISPHNRLTVFIKDLVQHNKPSRDACIQTTTSEEVVNETVDPLIIHGKCEVRNEKVDPLITHRGSDVRNETLDPLSTYREGAEVTNKTMDHLITHGESAEVTNKTMDHLITDGKSLEVTNKTMDHLITHEESIETLLKNFKDLFLNKENCDVTFKVQNQEFKAHRPILIARSPYFASMFRHNMSENNTGIVNVPDCCPGAFKELLLYLYSGTVETLSTDIVYDLYEVAIKYDLEYLKKLCFKFMEGDMSPDTFCDILTIALKHDELELILYAIDFFAKHMLDILPTVKWQLFLQENPTAANELYMKAAQKK